MEYVTILFKDEFYIVFNKLQEPIFEVKDTGISSRMMTYYSSEGLLFKDDKEINKTRKLSLIQLCWLKILKELITFGFDKESIVGFKRDLERDVYLNVTDPPRLFNTLTYFLTLLVSYEMDFRIVLYYEDMIFWDIWSDTHQIKKGPKRFSEKTIITIPLLGKIREEWESISGKKILIKEKIYQLIDPQEKELLEAMKNREIKKIELTFPDAHRKAGGKGQILKGLNTDDNRKVLEFLRSMKHGEVRLTYAAEPGVPVGGSVCQNIKFENLKEAKKQIIKHTK